MKKINVLPVGEAWHKKPERTKVFKNNNQLLLNVIVKIEHLLPVRRYSKYSTVLELVTHLIIRAPEAVLLASF